MLNQQKVARALEKSVPQFSHRYKQEYEYARALWSVCSHKEGLASLVRSADREHKLPCWSGALQQFYTLEKTQDFYRICGIDGSQIYPDRHYPVPCSLINIGIAGFNYATVESTAFLDSKPYLSFGAITGDYRGALTPELVDCCRTEFELQTGAWIAQKGSENTVVLFDGTLLFWFLESKDPHVCTLFMEKYCAQLEQLYQSRCLYGSYISYTKSKDIIHVLQKIHDLGIESLEVHLPDNSFSLLLDSDIMYFFLPSYCYSAVFSCQGPLVERYPESSRPCFLFYNTGQEIARVEMPAWIARDDVLVKKFMRIVANQTTKGDGYPLCLAEAHEQAVVKKSDRQLFYHMVGQYFCGDGQQNVYGASAYGTFSKKSFHKRSMGV